MASRSLSRCPVACLLRRLGHDFSFLRLVPLLVLSSRHAVSSSYMPSSPVSFYRSVVSHHYRLSLLSLSRPPPPPPSRFLLASHSCRCSFHMSRMKSRRPTPPRVITNEKTDWRIKLGKTARADEGEAITRPTMNGTLRRDGGEHETSYGKTRRGDERGTHNDTMAARTARTAGSKDAGGRGQRHHRSRPNGQSGPSHAPATTGNRAWKTTAPSGDAPPRYLRRIPTTRRYAASPLRRAMTDDTNEYDEKTRRPARRSHETPHETEGNPKRHDGPTSGTTNGTTRRKTPNEPRQHEKTS